MKDYNFTDSHLVNNKKSGFVKWIKRDYGCYLFLLPIILGFAVFTAYPIISSFFYSLTDYNGIFFSQFGLQNFQKLFSLGADGLLKDIGFSFGITFLWAVISIPLGMVLGYIVALVVNREIKGVKVFRLLYYMPTIIPGVAMSFIWYDVFRADGLANQFLGLFGMHSQFLDGENTALATLIFTGLWGMGGNIIMWLAALRNIPPEMYEAAALDGAGYFKQLFKITIPMSTPMIFYNLINAMIAALQAFDVYAMVGRGPNDCLYFISIRIYETAFGGGARYGLASAMGWLLFAVIAVLTVIAFKSNKWVNYGDGE